MNILYRTVDELDELMNILYRTVDELDEPSYFFDEDSLTQTPPGTDLERSGSGIPNGRFQNYFDQFTKRIQ